MAKRKTSTSPWDKFAKSAGAKPVVGKGSSIEMLPSRHALAQLTHGDPAQRSIGNYARLTPSGSGAPSTYDTIQKMGEVGIDPKKR